ncbi:hypothetical protein BJV77DRAFT_412175 [Russula vinacea]|nr:hypothetical protein BJV77DRAFT_412175 [Russula vinacea]
MRLRFQDLMPKALSGSLTLLWSKAGTRRQGEKMVAICNRCSSACRMSTHNVTNEMEDGNFLSCVHKVYRRSYLYGSQLFLHQNRGAYLFFLFFGFSSSVHLFQLLVYNITVNLAPSAEGHQFEFDLNCEATIYTTDGTPLQVLQEVSVETGESNTFSPDTWYSLRFRGHLQRNARRPLEWR